jgi:hypothetical protein
MMKFKLLLAGTIFLFLAVVVSANPFVTMGMQGMQAAVPGAGQFMSAAGCVSNLMTCAVGWGQGEALGALTQTLPEVAPVLDTYNQVNGYIDQGAEITSALEVNDAGGIEKGTIHLAGEDEEIGNLVGGGNISGGGVTVEKSEGISKITFDEEGGLNVSGNEFGNVDNNSYIELDSEGEIISANLTATNNTSFTFGGENVSVKGGTQVLMEDEEITVIGEENFKLSNEGRKQPLEIQPNGREIMIKEDEILGEVVGGDGTMDEWLDFDGEVRPNGENSFSMIGQDTTTALEGDFIIGDRKLSTTNPTRLSGRKGFGDEFSGVVDSENSYKLAYEPGQEEIVFDFKSQDIGAANGGEINRVNDLGKPVDLWGKSKYDLEAGKRFQNSLGGGNSFSSVGDTRTQYIFERNVGDGTLSLGSRKEIVEISTEEGYGTKIDNFWGFVLTF